MSWVLGENERGIRPDVHRALKLSPSCGLALARHVRRVSAAKVEVNAWPTWPRPMRYSVVRVI
jgi:hypothetical protein